MTKTKTCDESSSDFVDVLLDLQKENKLSAQT